MSRRTSTPAWLLLATLALVALNLRAVLTAIPPLTLEIQQVTGWNDTTMGLLTTLPVIVMGLAALIVPWLAQRLGRPQTVWLALGVLILASAGRLAAGVPIVLFITAFLGGLGIALASGLVPAIVREDRVLLVEGYTDVMALHQAGVKHAVASSGTALTEGQIKLIRRFTRRVTVLYDGDAAGIRASLRGIDLLLAAGCDVQVVRFPDGDDPDSFSHKVSPEELRQFLDTESQDFLAFKVSLLGADAGADPTRRAEMIHSVLDSLAAIPDPVRRSVYIQQCVASLGMPEEMLLLEVSRRIRDQATAADRRSRATTHPALAPPLPEETPSHALAPPSRRAVIEEDLVRLLLLYGDRAIAVPVEEGEPLNVPFAEYAIHLLDTQGCCFLDATCSAVVEGFRSALDRGELPAADVWNRHNDPEVPTLVAHVSTVRHEVSPNWTLRHGIYPEFEHDRLDKALHDGLHLLLLDEKERAATALEEELVAAWTRVEAGDDSAEAVVRDLLAAKMALDRDVRTLASYFGTTVLR